MAHEQRRLWGVVCIGLFVVAGAFLGCGEGGTGPDEETFVTVPASWAGVWEITEYELTCDLEDTNSVVVVVDTLCVGQPISDVFDIEISNVNDLQCNGTFTDSGFSLTCGGTLSFPGCEGVVSFDMSGSLSGDTASGSSLTTATWTPAGCGGTANGQCTNRTSFTARRIGPSPGDCLIE